MGNPQAAETAAALRLLPSTDDLMHSSGIEQLIAVAGRRRLTSLARQAIEELRQELLKAAGSKRSETYTKESLLSDAVERLNELWRAAKNSRIRKVINATGVIVHTNLGRAPLSTDALDAIKNAAGYATVEYDLTTGSRGRRGASVERMLTELTGAEAALVVNNCAAAAFLVLTVFAKGAETIVSRGELVEIGGDFRIPDVLVQSGSRLVEVGTTNRTKLADYERAIGENTAVVMSVHPSNYRIVGFTERPSLADLADLCHRKQVLLYEDAGSGALFDLSAFGLSDEPVIGSSISDGADIVTFSGDKLLGGTQAGLIVGRRDRIEQIRKHPLYRALRADKLSYAALEATLEAYLRDGALEDVPVMRMLSISKEELETRVLDFAKRLRERLPNVGIETVDADSVVGGGSAPATRLASVAITLSRTGWSAEAIEERLRLCETPVIARIENDRVVVDLRTVDPAEEGLMFDMIVAALG